MPSKVAAKATMKSNNNADSTKEEKKNKRTTISSREIQNAVRLLLPSELSNHAISEGTKAVTKYQSSK